MNKRAVIQLIVAQIEAEIAALLQAAKATHAEATDEQNKPENKYDTRALEASYLARGQSRQVMDLVKAKQEFEALAVVDSPGAIEVGSLLSLKCGDDETVYFLGPKGGGIEVSHKGTSVTVITPQSPLGQQLMGKAKGQFVVLSNDPGQKKFQITRIW